MNLIRKIGALALLVLAVLGLVVDVGYVFYGLFDTTSTSADILIGAQTPTDFEEPEEETEDNLDSRDWFIEANYYSNENNNGIALQEVKFHNFFDYEMTSEKRDSITMQFVGRYEEWIDERLAWLEDKSWDAKTMGDYCNQLGLSYYSKNGAEISKASNYLAPCFNYYSTYLDLSADWKGLQDKLNRASKLIVQVGGKPYRIQLTEKSTVPFDTRQYLLWWKVSGEKGTHNYYTLYGQIFYDIMSGIKTNSAGEGTFYTCLNLSKYFSVEAYDTKTNKWYQVTADDVTIRTGVKFHYSKNGAVRSTQSLAHIIDDDPSYDYVDRVYDTNYWQERVKLTLTAKDFEYRYSETLDGWLMSMPIAVKSEINAMPKVELTIELNLTDVYLFSRKMNVIGVDYNGFENLRIKNLIIRGGGEFTFFDKSLNNTHLATLQHSQGLNVVMLDDVINTEYREVIL